MPTNFSTNTLTGTSVAIDNLFVTADSFRQGNLWAWGRNDDIAQLGDNTLISRSTPVTTLAGGANWKQVACGVNYTAAIKTDGTLWTWGSNGYGQLGDNTAVTRSTPVTTFAGGTNWKQVSCSRIQTAAIKTDGTLWTWGTNSSYGILGNNTTTIRSTPVTTFAGGTNWKQVGCQRNCTIAIKTDGTLWVWGSNSSAQLGDNTLVDRLTPVTTFAGGTDWKQVSQGQGNSVSVIKTDGTLWSWGRNFRGELGDNTQITRSIPVTTFAGGNNWKQVASTGYTASAIKTDGTLWIWGQNTTTQAGNNGNTNILTPITTFAGGTNWKQVSCGSIHTAAIKTDGTLWTWGGNVNGRLGLNITTLFVASTPVTTFAGGTNWKQVACGDGHIAAVTYIDDYQ